MRPTATTGLSVIALALVVFFLEENWHVEKEALGSFQAETQIESSARVDTSYKSNLAKGTEQPDVVVYGIGDSGTRAFNDFLFNVGNVRMCEGQTSRSKDCNPTKMCHNSASLSRLLSQSSRPAQISAMQATNDTEFNLLVQCEHEQSRVVLNGTERTDNEFVFWGYKNPRHAYIVPILQQAFGNNTAMILVARHPYDICSGSNRGQYHHFGELFAKHEKDHVSCMEFWTEVMGQLVSIAEANSHIMRLIRIETLVLDSSKDRDASARCVANLVGYKHNYQATMDATAIMAKYSSSYGGQSRLVEGGKKHAQWQKSVNDTTIETELLAQKLGYNLPAYGDWELVEELLPRPTSLIVC